jgi:YD repeat-containing protein
LPSHLAKGSHKYKYAYDAQGNRKAMTATGEANYTVTYGWKSLVLALLVEPL